jgi:3-oxoacyl-[acyl-carrier protein] reductase
VADSILITGGHGCLATAIAGYFLDQDPNDTVWTPSRQELDVTCEASIAEYMSDHPCSLLVCAAGEINDRLIAKTSTSLWDQIVATNLHGAALCAREAIKSMQKNGIGHIIFISSYSAIHPPVGQIAYASAKAGLLGLTKSLAREYGSSQIRVNAILPGFMENTMTAAVPLTRKEQILSDHVLGHLNTEKQVAQFIHLLHKNLLYTSGQIINLDSRIL